MNTFKNLFTKTYTTSRPLVTKGLVSKNKPVPSHIRMPEYALNGQVGKSPDKFITFSGDQIPKIRKAGRLARKMVEFAVASARPGVSTDYIDALTFDEIVRHNAYPSPVNYAGFPKAICTSVNEVVCHGIPDDRVLQHGDVLSIDVSVYTEDGYHGDNCRTVIVGDQAQPASKDVGAAPGSSEDKGVAAERFAELQTARRLVLANMEALDEAIRGCEAGRYLNEIGATIEDVATAHGFTVVSHFCGHGVGPLMHMPPLVMHHRNDVRLQLQPGMVFTIEPILIEGPRDELMLWEEDGWTAATQDNSRGSQFEHQILILPSGPPEVLTSLTDDEYSLDSWKHRKRSTRRHDL